MGKVYKRSFGNFYGLFNHLPEMNSRKARSCIMLILCLQCIMTIHFSLDWITSLILTMNLYHCQRGSSTYCLSHYQKCQSHTIKASKETTCTEQVYSWFRKEGSKTSKWQVDRILNVSIGASRLISYKKVQNHMAIYGNIYI